MHQGNIAGCETLPLLVSFTACLTWKGLYIQRVETSAVPTFWAEVRGPGGNEAASRQGSLPTQQIGKLWFWHVEQMPAVILCLYNYLSSCWTWKIRAIQNGFVIFAPLCKVSFLIIERDPELSAVSPDFMLQPPSELLNSSEDPRHTCWNLLPFRDCCWRAHHTPVR